ncbi:MAG TPA: hypothetical protein DEG43_01775 [Acidimicrobiaceae bacterium]|nr:hypothetical protein [Acidimicrobiaceae bacterium]
MVDEMLDQPGPIEGADRATVVETVASGNVGAPFAPAAEPSCAVAPVSSIASEATTGLPTRLPLC